MLDSVNCNRAWVSCYCLGILVDLATHVTHSHSYAVDSLSLCYYNITSHVAVEMKQCHTCPLAYFCLMFSAYGCKTVWGSWFKNKEPRLWADNVCVGIRSVACRLKGSSKYQGRREWEKIGQETPCRTGAKEASLAHVCCNCGGSWGYWCLLWVGGGNTSSILYTPDLIQQLFVSTVHLWGWSSDFSRHSSLYLAVDFKPVSKCLSTRFSFIDVFVWALTLWIIENGFMLCSEHLPPVIWLISEWRCHVVV